MSVITSLSNIAKAIIASLALYCLYNRNWLTSLSFGLLLIIFDVYGSSGQTSSILPLAYRERDQIISLNKPKRSLVATLIQIFFLFQLVIVLFISSHSLFNESIYGNKPISNSNFILLDKSITDSKIDNNVKQIVEANVKNLPNEINEPESPILTTYIHIPTASKPLLKKTFGKLYQSSFPDLKYRGSSEVRQTLERIFKEVPSPHFNEKFKNPCWFVPVSNDPEDGKKLECLPYVYVLGQPKCGSSDLFERLRRHDKIRAPRRKEIRWFTRGEFQTTAMDHEGDSNANKNGRNELLLSKTSSVYSFTKHFSDAASVILDSPENSASIITIDGGPHTFWWPTQSPDGALMPDEIPPPQIIREMQPQAKFIITLTDPVKRMYSDYYFLGDDLRPVFRPNSNNEENIRKKSAIQFNERVKEQIKDFNDCIEKTTVEISESDKVLLDLGENDVTENVTADGIWLRASQICAHNRHKFAVGGWGRISIGLYSLYLEKWLEHFSPDQFLILRLEDFSTNPKAYLKRVFDFLDVGEPKDWTRLIETEHFNEYYGKREPILAETEQILREFYKPYNQLLSSMLENDKSFLWEDYLYDNNKNIITLREYQILQNKESNNQPHPEHSINPLNHMRPDRPNQPDISIIHPRGADKAVKPQIPVDKHNNEFMKSLVPKRFSLDGLTIKNELGQFISQNMLEKCHTNVDAAANILCVASFTMDLKALKVLLYDIGIPATITIPSEVNRGPYHCLAMLSQMSDANSKSHIFALLKGKKNWLTDFMEPSIVQKQSSPLGRDIIEHIQGSMIETAKWLDRAGFDVNHADDYDTTALHYAAAGNEVALVKFMLDHGANPNIINKDHRTALHYAVAWGHGLIGKLLVDAKSDWNLEDTNGVKPIDVISNPGPILPYDALTYFNISQRKAKQIQRVLHPENVPVNSTGGRNVGWIGGAGGWGAERLKGFEDDMSCDNIDQYWADEITGEEIFHKYIARNAPVLIRGLLENWEVINNYKKDILREDKGSMKVQASDIPYSKKFGGVGALDLELGDYIHQVEQHRITGGTHPWYVFKGHPVPQQSDAPGSLVLYEDCPTPKIMNNAFQLMNPNLMNLKGTQLRKMFVNAQWALGGEGTGAPVHFHNTAWAALIYGAKKWFIYPPENMIMSNKQILEYYETDMLEFQNRGVRPVTCVQTAGDVMMIPESWAHGVLNIQESVGIASEVKESTWRIKPFSRTIGNLPSFDNRREAPPQL
eukprot:gene7166-9769_t